ncbi:MAG: hypothetical protein ACD_28C00388G0002 [uncultured bacterium]|nr:MAG: hypothetical protein ACD_28C00388G0002 [uncultured bacterium]KKT76635.1 MAG: hypothetical protein UW70_C0016G0015 [Candidatus Peregrinibacteria bacterium GW2011_GWA2_44_7]
MEPQTQSITFNSQNLEAQADQVAAAQAKEQTGQTAGTPPAKSTVKNAQKNAARSTQMHLQIAELRDNLAVLKNGGIRAVLKTSSVNVHLKSEDEQNAIIYSYQNFLNTLEFPIQIVVRSKKLDLDDYIDKLKGIAEKQTNPLLKDQTVDYVDYIQRLIEYADIMQKDFYVIVPFDPPRAKKVSFIQKFIEHMSPKDSLAQLRQRHQEFETLRKGMSQRMNIVKSGLENCGLKVDQLTTEELITLFYECYNPRTSRIQKFKKSDDLDVVRDPDLYTAKQIEEDQ